MAKQLVTTAFNAAFEYDTPKIVHIKSKKVGFINRLIQLCILGYIIGYAIVWEKGYQEFENIVSAASTKVKGVSFTNLSESKRPELGVRIWDVADYVIPPQENDAFFVMTNAIVTFNQTQTICDEDPTNVDALCKTNADCPKYKPVQNGNGVRTGKCIPSRLNASINVCEIYAWCPVEEDKAFPLPGKPLLENAHEFTVLIKNQIEFPMFEVKLRNIIDTYNASYLQNCRYNSSDPVDRFCPIFELGYIVKEAQENFTQLALSGGFILVKINWDCNLDKSIDQCVPVYSFRRLDDKDSKIAKGWNFRYANFYYEEGVEYRDLIKAYGLRFVIKVTGRAGKFSFVPLLLNLGSGLGLLAIATVLCDIVTMYFLKKGNLYKEKKYLFVEDLEEEQGFVNSGSHQRSYQSTDHAEVIAEPSSNGSDNGSGTVTNRRQGAASGYAKLEEDQ